MIQIQLPTDSASFTFTVRLGDRDYDCSCRYNGIADRWSLTIVDVVTRETVVRSVALVRGTDRLEGGRSAATVPGGVLFVSGPTEAGLRDLGRTVNLFFEPFPAAEGTTGTAGT